MFSFSSKNTEALQARGQDKAPRLSTENLYFPLFLSLAPEIQERILDSVVETGTTWRTGTTLHINGVLFQRAGTRADTTFIALSTQLGFVKKVRLIPYLFERDEEPNWGIGRSLSRILPKLFHILRNIIPREVPIILEEEDRKIVELIQAGIPYFIWYAAYEQKYNIPLTVPLVDDDGWMMMRG